MTPYPKWLTTNRQMCVTMCGNRTKRILKHDAFGCFQYFITCVGTWKDFNASLMDSLAPSFQQDRMICAIWWHPSLTVYIVCLFSRFHGHKISIKCIAFTIVHLTGIEIMQLEYRKNSPFNRLQLINGREQLKCRHIKILPFGHLA